MFFLKLFISYLALMPELKFERALFPAHIVQPIVYARHGRELMGCKSPTQLYVALYPFNI
jgi:hypothetical protein